MNTTETREPGAQKPASRRRIPWQLRLLRLAFTRLGPLIPGPMAAWAYRLWFQTRRHPASATEQQARSRAARWTLPVAGIPVAVYRWGAGPVVVFVHGWSGRATQVAHFIEPLVQAGFQVVAFDAPAHGETPGSRIASAWPGARFRKTRGLGHRRILRDPATIDVVVEFFRAQ